jgi:hypothetical protein
MATKKLLEIHKKLIFNHGLLSEEFPEQIMAINILKKLIQF